MLMGMMMRVKIKAHITMPGELQVNDVVVILTITVKIEDHSIVPREAQVIAMQVLHNCQSGWQKLCGGPCRKVWTRTKILSPNIRYFVAN